ncbi:hypothetical protein, partial [Prevotella sp.]|uniref:hypothetical protein n=1 Tax=Prevotella sp. TaxID=59823 RepID=UPI003F7F04F4
ECEIIFLRSSLFNRTGRNYFTLSVSTPFSTRVIWYTPEVTLATGIVQSIVPGTSLHSDTTEGPVLERTRMDVFFLTGVLNDTSKKMFFHNNCIYLFIMWFHRDFPDETVNF